MRRISSHQTRRQLGALGKLSPKLLDEMYWLRPQPWGYWAGAGEQSQLIPRRGSSGVRTYHLPLLGSILRKLAASSPHS
jgi:hypothetical protein